MPRRRRYRNSAFGYLRARLRRRLFAWFGVTIIVTTISSAGIMWLLAPGMRSYRWHLNEISQFVGKQFAQVWDDPPARERFAQSIAQDLNVGLQLTDARSSNPVAQFGPTCDRYRYEIDIQKGANRVGVVRACLPFDHARGVTPGAVGLLVAIAALWGMSGIIAWRVTRPLAQLVRVTGEIGRGNLDVRMNVRRTGGGEFAVLAEAVNDMAARIAKQLGDQRELLATVSHEIRTPLGHMWVLIDLARGEGADPKLLANLEQEVKTIDRQVDQLLASSRLDFGTIDRRRLDAVDVAVSSLERAQLQPTVLVVEATNTEIQGDAALLSQALANLLRNADDHGGSVTRLHVTDTQDGVSFDVEDDGPGFDEAQLPRAFDSFRTGASKGDRHGGSLGLGLSLVRRIAAAHGGVAHARNLPEGGARVGFTVNR